MRRCAWAAAGIGLIGVAAIAAAQEAGPGAPWRGAGAPPCFSSEGGTFSVPCAARSGGGPCRSGCSTASPAGC
jgi:hypothetical protein